MIVKLADLDGFFPAEVFFELALLCYFVFEIGEMERHQLGRDVVEDRGVCRLRLGAEDVAVGFWCVGGGGGAAGCFAGRFVGSPLASLAVLAAVPGGFASAANEGAGICTRIVGADLRHRDCWGFSKRVKDVLMFELEER